MCSTSIFKVVQRKAKLSIGSGTSRKLRTNFFGTKRDAFSVTKRLRLKRFLVLQEHVGAQFVSQKLDANMHVLRGKKTEVPKVSDSKTATARFQVALGGSAPPPRFATLRLGLHHNLQPWHHD